MKEYFLDVKNDIDGICYGTYFCDVLEYLCVEGVGDVNILNLIYVTLKALMKKEIPNPLVRRIFELKVLAFDGEAMAAFSCVNCGKTKVAAFFAGGNGLLCEECAKKIEGVQMLSESAVYTIQYVLSENVNKIYTFHLSEEVWQEFDKVVELYFWHHVQKKFKSLEILSSLS